MNDTTRKPIAQGGQHSAPATDASIDVATIDNEAARIYRDAREAGKSNDAAMYAVGRLFRFLDDAARELVRDAVIAENPWIIGGAWGLIRERFELKAAYRWSDEEAAKRDQPEPRELVDAAVEERRAVGKVAGDRAADDVTRERWHAIPAGRRPAVLAYLETLHFRPYPPLTDAADCWCAAILACEEGLGICTEAALDRYELGLAAAEWRRDDGGVMPVLTDGDLLALEFHGDEEVDRMARELGIMPVSGGAPEQSVELGGECVDSRGIPIYPGDLIRSPHFVDRRGRRRWLYHVAVRRNGRLWMIPARQLDEGRDWPGSGEVVMKPRHLAGSQVISGHGPDDVLSYRDRPRRPAEAVPMPDWPGRRPVPYDEVVAALRLALDSQYRDGLEVKEGNAAARAVLARIDAAKPAG